MTETTEQTDKRRARALLAGEAFCSWEDASISVRETCLREAAAIRASDEAAGMVLVPKSAPELLDALMDALAGLATYYRQKHPDWDGSALPSSTIGKARAAIAKATGK
jgi:hypothetical protein